MARKLWNPDTKVTITRCNRRKFKTDAMTIPGTPLVIAEVTDESGRFCYYSLTHTLTGASLTEPAYMKKFIPSLRQKGLDFWSELTEEQRDLWGSVRSQRILQRSISPKAKEVLTCGTGTPPSETMKD